MITFLSTSLNYPIHWQRIQSLSVLGAKTNVLGFEQELGYSTVAPPISYQSFGRIRSGHYARRLMQMFVLIRTIRNSTKKTKLVYAFGVDGALLALISGLLSGNKTKLVYEIHDIRQLMLEDGIRGNLARFVEKTILKNTDLLVVTSESYITRYYTNILQQKVLSYYVIENKLWPHEIKRRATPALVNVPLRIGYFGSLRCQIAWNTLRQLAKNLDGFIEIYVRGVPSGIKDFEHDVSSISGLNYGGPFEDPDDIQQIYESVNIVWAAGFNQKDSYAWSRTCRFYNSCCYKRPLITQIDTDEGKIVEELNIGISIDLNDELGAIELIKRITQQQLSVWQNNLEQLPRSTYTYTDEHKILMDRCVELMRDE